jgi:TolB-like protein/DNA-binding winged helix-turn-helix (wHTH) protein
MRFRFGKFELDTEARTLQRDGGRVRLQAKVFDLLAYLIEHRERAASIDELLDALWPGVSVTPSALSRAVHKAREAVEDDGERQAVLLTEHGHGFRFVAEVSVLSDVEGAAQRPTRFRTRWVAPAGVVALLLAVATAWLLNRPVAELAPIRSIAVLPFANMSGDPEQEYFSDGISEELINTLVQLNGLRVTGRTSSFSFKDSDADLKTIGTALNVDTILEGSVRTTGNRVRITAQLISTADGFHLWSETFERELEDIFAIQDGIARAIADALQIELRVSPEQPLDPGRTENLEAYTLI